MNESGNEDLQDQEKFLIDSLDESPQNPEGEQQNELVEIAAKVSAEAENLSPEQLQTPEGREKAKAELEKAIESSMQTYLKTAEATRDLIEGGDKNTRANFDRFRRSALEMIASVGQLIDGVELHAEVVETEKAERQEKHAAQVEAATVEPAAEAVSPEETIAKLKNEAEILEKIEESKKTENGIKAEAEKNNRYADSCAKVLEILQYNYVNAPKIPMFIRWDADKLAQKNLEKGLGGFKNLNLEELKKSKPEAHEDAVSDLAQFNAALGELVKSGKLPEDVKGWLKDGTAGLPRKEREAANRKILSTLESLEKDFRKQVVEAGEKVDAEQQKQQTLKVQSEGGRPAEAQTHAPTEKLAAGETEAEAQSSVPSEKTTEPTVVAGEEIEAEAEPLPEGDIIEEPANFKNKSKAELLRQEQMITEDLDLADRQKEELNELKDDYKKLFEYLKYPGNKEETIKILKKGLPKKGRGQKETAALLNKLENQKLISQKSLSYLEMGTAQIQNSETQADVEIEILVELDESMNNINAERADIDKRTKSLFEKKSKVLEALKNKK